VLVVGAGICCRSLDHQANRIALAHTQTGANAPAGWSVEVLFFEKGI
jgi:hypothetical protein